MKPSLLQWPSVRLSSVLWEAGVPSRNQRTPGQVKGVAVLLQRTMPARLYHVFLNFIWSQILSIKKHLLALPGKGMGAGRGGGMRLEDFLVQRKTWLQITLIKDTNFFKIWDKPKWAQETEESMNMIKLNYREHSKANCKVSQGLNQHFCHAQSCDWLQ